MSDIQALDALIAASTRAALECNPLPEWPCCGNITLVSVLERLEFHGTAFLIADAISEETDWPEAVCAAIKDEARQQALWETSHAQAIGALLEKLDAHGAEAFVMKGTALAYSVYADPAIRRRGDTDLLVETTDRAQVRKLFTQAGFKPAGDRRALQESWVLPAGDSFAHEVDLHWSPSASAALSASLSRDHPAKRSIQLPLLSHTARAMGPIDSLIQICINRAAHNRFGYGVGDRIVTNGDRLIWALDIHLIAADFTGADWRTLSDIAARIGALALVCDGLKFASANLGTNVPDGVLTDAIEHGQSNGSIERYLACASPFKRALLDLKSAENLSSRMMIAKQHLLPERGFLERKYPDTSVRSIWWLRVKRLKDAVWAMVFARRPH